MKGAQCAHLADNDVSEGSIGLAVVCVGDCKTLLCAGADMDCPVAYFCRCVCCGWHQQDNAVQACAIICDRRCCGTCGASKRASAVQLAVQHTVHNL